MGDDLWYKGCGDSRQESIIKNEHLRVTERTSFKNDVH